MMESTHTPSPGAPNSANNDDDDPFGSTSNLDDLAFDDENDGNTNDKSSNAAASGVGDNIGQTLSNEELDELVGGSPIKKDPSSAAPGAGTGGINFVAGNSQASPSPTANDDDGTDPWALLAAAAGAAAPPAPSPAPQNAAASTSNASAPTTLEPPVITPSEIAPSFSHAQGEDFSIQTGVEPNPQQRLAILGSQLQTSVAQIGSALSTTIQDVDAKTGVSTTVQNTTKNLEDNYHISEKWNNFQTNVWKPASERTIERTKEVTKSVGEKVGPSVKEGWEAVSKGVEGWKERLQQQGQQGGGLGAMSGTDGANMGNEVTQTDRGGEMNANSNAPIEGLGQKAKELHLAERWQSLSSAVGTRWQSAAAGVGESVEHWKEEHRKRMAAESANGGSREGVQVDLEGAKAKVVESWTGGMNWVSQRIQEAKSRENAGSSNVGNGLGTEATAVTGFLDKEMKRKDSDGLPSSFWKD